MIANDCEDCEIDAASIHLLVGGNTTARRSCPKFPSSKEGDEFQRDDTVSEKREIIWGDLDRKLYGSTCASATAIRAAQVALLSSSARFAAILVPSVSAPIRASRNGVIAGPVTCASAASRSAWASASAKSLSGSASASGMGQVTSSPPSRPLSHCARAIAAISVGVSARKGTRRPLVRQ